MYNIKTLCQLKNNIFVLCSGENFLVRNIGDCSIKVLTGHVRNLQSVSLQPNEYIRLNKEELMCTLSLPEYGGNAYNCHMVPRDKVIDLAFKNCNTVVTLHKLKN